MVTKVVKEETHYHEEDLDKLEKLADRAASASQVSSQDQDQIDVMLDMIADGDESKYAINLSRYDPTTPDRNKYGYICQMDIGEFNVDLVRQLYGGGNYRASLYNVETGRRVKGGRVKFSIEGRSKAVGGSEEGSDNSYSCEPPITGGRPSIPQRETMDPLALCDMVRQSIADGVALASKQHPQGNGDVNAIVKGVSDLHATLSQAVVRNMEGMSKAREELAQKEREQNSEFMKMMQTIMLQQTQANAAALEAQKTILAGWRDLYQAKAQIAIDGAGTTDSGSGIAAIAVKVLDIIQERGPDFVAAFKQGVVDGVVRSQPALPSSVPLPSVPPTLSTGVETITKNRIGGIVDEESGEDDDPVADVEDALERCFVSKYGFEDTAKVLRGAFSPEVLHETFLAYDDGTLSEGFYAGDLGNYISGLLKYLAEQVVENSVPDNGATKEE